MLRKHKKLVLLSVGLLSVISFTVKAGPVDSHRVMVAPQCLIKKLNADYKTLAATKQFALIEVDQNGIEKLITAKQQRHEICGGFMDVTESWNSANQHHIAKTDAIAFLSHYTQVEKKSLTAKTREYSIKYPMQVNQLLGQINPQAMWANLTTLTSFQDRYANSDNGVKAANWIKTQIENMAADYHRDDVTVNLVATGNSYKQPSVVVKIGKNAESGVVVGAHMDTLSGTFSKKPGADDDGSGSATILESARTVLASGMQFKKPIYFIWYSAEEEGLVGSGYVVADFKKKNIPVEAVIHFDMTGYAYKNDPAIWLMTDYVNKELTAYLETLITTYVKQPVKYSRCGYACSDHATWTQNGFPAALPAEAAYENTNPVLHSSQDTMEKLSLAHMTDYAKTATAFAVELAEPVK